MATARRPRPAPAPEPAKPARPYAAVKRAQRLRARQGALTDDERAWLAAYERERPSARQTLREQPAPATPAGAAAAAAPPPLQLATAAEVAPAASPAPAAAATTPAAAAAATATPAPSGAPAAPAPAPLVLAGGGDAAANAAANAAAREEYARQIADLVTEIPLGWNERAVELGAKDRREQIERGIRPLAHAIALKHLPQDLGPAGKWGQEVALGMSLASMRFGLWRLESRAAELGIEPRRAKPQLTESPAAEQPAAAAAAPSSSAAAPARQRAEDDDEEFPEPPAGGGWG